MIKDFDDELARMDELENDSDTPINQALTLNDPIENLSLRSHPIIESVANLKSCSCIHSIVRKSGTCQPS